MSDDLVKRWDEYVESMGCVMGEVEHMAQQMRDRIEELEAKLAKAVETLEYYAVEALPWDDDDSLLARTTLAELEGGAK